MCIACFQPIARAELSSFFGKEISRDLISNLRSAGLLSKGKLLASDIMPGFADAGGNGVDGAIDE